MILYRISNSNYAGDISGTGSKLFGGRWNSVGTPLHYMSSSRALAAMEVLVNKSNLRDTKNFCMSIFEVPESSLEIVDVQDLPTNWRSYPSISFLKKIGDDFVRRNDALLLRVPSAVIEDEFNFLMNTSHILVKDVKILDVKPFSFDTRLV